jgi:hypothetical protein
LKTGEWAIFVYYNYLLLHWDFNNNMFLAVNVDEIRDIFVRVDFHRRQSPVFPRPAKRNALLDDGAVLTSPHH